ncbi:hypothetical protein XA68_11775 [Ophiocordyceps unilateralis]|uniref:Uncharacterized protein n=1 Tax=Ophiocordyceps unilateralis TaxID=268505 RepID=A0A2A9PEB8_OPHUN|nr:hypothetical protein XA68_11775 [Ophiocordyceps unilateralis]
MDAERVSPQPNFPLAVDNSRSVEEQLERCGNLPAVGGGASLDDRMERIEALLQEIRGMLQSMHRRMDAMDTNAVVRIENNSLLVIGVTELSLAADIDSMRKG